MAYFFFLLSVCTAAALTKYLLLYAVIGTYINNIVEL